MNRLFTALLAILLAASPVLAGGNPTTLYDVAGNPIGTQGNPFALGPAGCTLTQLPAVTGTSGLLIAANPARKSLRWMNVGAADVTVAPGTTPPAAGIGMVYTATAAGKQGGSETFNDPGMATNAFAFSAPSSATVIVWECQ